MKQRIFNYTVLISKEKRLGTKDDCYTALVPVLGIATEADTLEEIQKEAKSLIRFHLDSLVDEGEDIPSESGDSFVTKFQMAV